MAGSVVAVIQSIANPGDLDQSVQDHVRLAEDAARQGARIALFPELSLTGYSHSLTRADSVAPSDPRMRSLQAVADAHDILIGELLACASREGETIIIANVARDSEAKAAVTQSAGLR
jgi:5-aminopentanamidase